MNEHIREAATFIEQLELPPRPRRLRGAPAVESINDFDAQKDQAVVVGSDIVSFVAGITPQLRAAIVNSSLLAQLAANRKVPERNELRAWYDVYFDTLTRLGWQAQERGFSEHHETGEDFEAAKAILSIAGAIFGPTATALAIVASTLKAMESLSDGPWFAVFERGSRSAKAARFQVSTVEPSSDGSSYISMMAFELDAKTALTQVLFFKYRASDVTLRHASGRVSVDSEILAAIAPAVAEKVAAYTRNFVAAVQI
jgi:hypothetical protein